jgi:hypothetical protein
LYSLARMPMRVLISSTESSSLVAGLPFSIYFIRTRKELFELCFYFCPAFYTILISNNSKTIKISIILCDKSMRFGWKWWNNH